MHAAATYAHIDPPVRWCVADRVLDQVGDQLAQPITIADDDTATVDIER